MPATFPTGLPGLKINYVDNVDDILAANQNQPNLEINALATKVGVDNSLATTSHDYKLSRITGTTKALDDSSVTQTANRIYCMGDSLTVGYPGTGYQSQLLTLLGSPWLIENKGINGNTTTNMVTRFTSDIVDQTAGVYCIIWAGINDLASAVANATIESNLQAMYTAAHNAGYKVIAVNVSPFKNAGSWSAGIQTNVDIINTWIANTATNIDYKVDAYTLLEDPGAADALLATYDSGDHLHLSDAGYSAVGTAIYNALTWSLGNTLFAKRNIFRQLVPPQGFMINGQIVSELVSTNHLKVSIKTLNASNPSTDDPVYVRIGNNVRTITAALSVTLEDGTNWFGSGSAVTATQDVDYFVYLGYSPVDGVVIGFARIPYAVTYADFSTTNTSNLYCAISTITNALNSDIYENIGRIKATLSAGAGYTWSIPVNKVINRPIFESDLLSYVPTYTGFTATDPGGTWKYRHINKMIYLETHIARAGVSNATTFRATFPFEPVSTQDFVMTVIDNGTSKVGCCYIIGGNYIDFGNGGRGANFTTSGDKYCYGSFWYSVAN
jgi:lysophospholipase L1-like esterase